MRNMFFLQMHALSIIFGCAHITILRSGAIQTNLLILSTRWCISLGMYVYLCHQNIDENQNIDTKKAKKRDRETLPKTHCWIFQKLLLTFYLHRMFHNIQKFFLLQTLCFGNLWTNCFSTIFSDIIFANSNSRARACTCTCTSSSTNYYERLFDA